MNIVSKVKYTVIVSIVSAILVIVLQQLSIYKKDIEISNAKYKLINYEASMDSLRKIGIDTYSKLVYIEKEKKLIEEEKLAIGRKLSNKVTEVTRLKIELDSITVNYTESIPDTVFIVDSGKSSIFKYSKDFNEDLSIHSTVLVKSRYAPDNIDLSILVEPTIANIGLVTTRLNDGSYEVTVRSNSKWLKIGDIRTTVLREDMKKKILDIGIGIETGKHQSAFTMIRNGHHSGTLSYDFSDKSIGIGYMLWLRNKL